MKILISVAAMLVASASWAQSIAVSHCRFPEPPSLVDGASATEEDMAAGAAAVRAFVQDMQASLVCIDEVEAGLGEDITAEEKSSLTVLYNNGVDQMSAIAESYNAQVRAFNGR